MPRLNLLFKLLCLSEALCDTIDYLVSLNQNKTVFGVCCCGSREIFQHMHLPTRRKTVRKACALLLPCCWGAGGDAWCAFLSSLHVISNRPQRAYLCLLLFDFVLCSCLNWEFWMQFSLRYFITYFLSLQAFLKLWNKSTCFTVESAKL